MDVAGAVALAVVLVAQVCAVIALQSFNFEDGKEPMDKLDRTRPLSVAGIDPALARGRRLRSAYLNAGPAPKKGAQSVIPAA